LLVMTMKYDILFLLARGAKTDVELAAFLGASQLPAIKRIIEDLIASGSVRVRARQIRQVGNIVYWEREYLTRSHTSSAA